MRQINGKPLATLLWMKLSPCNSSRHSRSFVVGFCVPLPQQQVFHKFSTLSLAALRARIHTTHATSLLTMKHSKSRIAIKKELFSSSSYLYVPGSEKKQVDEGEIKKKHCVSRSKKKSRERRGGKNWINNKKFFKNSNKPANIVEKEEKLFH